MLIVAIAVRFTSKGPIIFWSERAGQNNVMFRMPKFRSMRRGAPNLPTYMIKNPSQILSPIGLFLRRTSLDELPQLFVILKGDMSFVGPRPVIFSESELIDLRAKNGVSKLLPGLTGWAQVNGRDSLSVIEKVNLDKEYLDRQSFLFDLKIIWITFLKVLRREDISH